MGQNRGASVPDQALVASDQAASRLAPAGFDPSCCEDTYEDEGPKCPYCGRQYTADDPVYFDEMNYTEQTCDECGLTFDVDVYTSTTWTCSPRASAIEARRAADSEAGAVHESATRQGDAQNISGDSSDTD